MANIKLKLSCSVFDEHGFLVKIEYCSSSYSLYHWLNNSYKYKSWKYYNIYNRKTGNYITRQYKNSTPINDKDLFR